MENNRRTIKGWEKDRAYSKEREAPEWGPKIRLWDLFRTEPRGKVVRWGVLTHRP